MSDKFRLSTISQIAITISDLEPAVRFYRDALGLKHLYTLAGMAFFDCDGVRLMLAHPSTEELDHPSSIVYFDVDDIHRAHRSLSDRGVGFEREPHLVARMDDRDLWMAFFRDPDRNILAISSETPVGADQETDGDTT